MFQVEDYVPLRKALQALQRFDRGLQVRVCCDRKELVQSDFQYGFHGYLYLHSPTQRFLRFDNPQVGAVLMESVDNRWGPSWVAGEEAVRSSYSMEELNDTSLVGESVCVIDGDYRRLRGVVLNEFSADGQSDVDIQITTMTLTRVINVERRHVRHLDALRQWSGNFEYGLIDNLLTEVDACRRIEQAAPTDAERDRIRLKFIALTEDFLRRLPSEEYDFLVLFYLDSVPQRSIGKLFGITQRAVSYRISRAVERLRFLVSIADVDEETMQHDLIAVFADEEAVDIVLRVYRSTNLSEVQRQTGQTFFYVRSRFCSIIERLEQLDTTEMDVEQPELAGRLESYLRVLRLVQENFGILNARNKVRRLFVAHNL